MDVQPEDEIGPRLRALGLAAADVRWVVLTHLHSDHAGGLGHFPRADILVAADEYALARGVRGRLEGYLPQHWPAWFAPRPVAWRPDPVGPFPVSAALTRADDVRLVPTPGHTPGHLSVIVRDGNTSFFLAGDTSYSEPLLRVGVVDGVAPDVTAARRTLARINSYVEAIPTVYLPTHDPDAASRLTARQVIDARPGTHAVAGTSA
jgi:glyoxylase-like metal-dependent hydrolase (beta-lactamase superfamily II)